MNAIDRAGPGGEPTALEQALTTLVTSLTNLGTEVRALRLDVQAGERRRKRGQKWIGAGVVVVITLVALLGVVSWQNRKVLDSTSQTNETILECTTPGRQCYEEGRKRTAEAFQYVLLVSIYMGQCARLYPDEAGPTYDRKLKECVLTRLGLPATSPSPSPTPAPTGGG